MTEFLHHLMHPLPNAVMTAIMGVLVLYWLFVFLLGVGMDDLDLGFDFDVDVPEPEASDVEVEGAGDDDVEVPQEKSPGFFMKFLTFMNVGRVPFMLILSFWKFFAWVGSLITTQFVDVSGWGVWSLLLLLPLLVIALLFTKFSTTPLAKFFKAIGYKGEEEIDFLGRSGKMLSNIKDDKIGCAELLIDKNPIKLNVRSMDGEELKYGDYIIVSDESDDKKIYLVTKEISIRNF
ncbi:OB-fold-containig protein [Bacteroides sp. 224]|uniref:OB-fold-containig protein n=1 Tax=Bacteroides sp. 224 TaxID=2302936 RepID=UPI0013D8118B|nr:OB-fold-containig protein [Bacteroides sp. 224]NDV66322.1 DUF1449 family protein [Bacteroides sp. 224]